MQPSSATTTPRRRSGAQARKIKLGEVKAPGEGVRRASTTTRKTSRRRRPGRAAEEGGRGAEAGQVAREGTGQRLRRRGHLRARRLGEQAGRSPEGRRPTRPRSAAAGRRREEDPAGLDGRRAGRGARQDTNVKKVVSRRTARPGNAPRTNRGPAEAATAAIKTPPGRRRPTGRSVTPGITTTANRSNGRRFPFADAPAALVASQREPPRASDLLRSAELRLAAEGRRRSREMLAGTNDLLDVRRLERGAAPPPGRRRAGLFRAAFRRARVGDALLSPACSPRGARRRCLLRRALAGDFAAPWPAPAPRRLLRRHPGPSSAVDLPRRRRSLGPFTRPPLTSELDLHGLPPESPRGGFGSSRDEGCMMCATTAPTASTTSTAVFFARADAHPLAFTASRTPRRAPSSAVALSGGDDHALEQRREMFRVEDLDVWP